ncbi:MAG: hypothetical protein WCI72_05475 [archaeon]
MNEKPWYENEKVPEAALASFRACARYTDDQLAEVIDKRMHQVENDPFPTAKGCSRRSLDIMFYIEDIMAKDRIRQMATKDRLEKLYSTIPDDEVEGTYLRFLAGLQKLPFRLHIGIDEPTDVSGMRDYMVKVQYVLEQRQSLADKFGGRGLNGK